ncbi:integrin alpha-PS4-like [Diabrotica undecimpunctata]|uniref:integrin alpha-PS4-like n=1 Tax=Diabrotica undecimpunctata TaxID=50387 RepID=UPI003B631E0F
MQFILLTLSLFCVKVKCFNFDTDFPIVFSDRSSTEKTYFGYSVAMYPGRLYSEKILVGAPKSNDTKYPGVERPGIAYDCHVKMGCRPIDFPHSTEQPQEQWKHGFVGGTMDISYNQSRVAVCGFRQYYIVNGDYRSMGACFWSFLNKTEFKNIKPLLNTGKGTYSYGKMGSVYFYGQSEAGFSAHLPERENELILGAPGTLNWAGTPLRVYDLEYDNPEPSRRKRQIDPKRSRRELEPFKNVMVPDSTRNEAFNLFGYSVTSGYYFGPNTILYASGSPKANGYNGKVVVFKFNDEAPIRVFETKNGEQFGEYFGASLASGDVNGDTFDDLLVGAPFYKGSTYNEGRVFIFLGGRSNLQTPTIISGTGRNGQFGTSIIYMGDIDNDGFGEVAISAPYENENTGNVYIYKGAQDGLLAKPCQVIEGKEIFSGLLGFGITISKAVDMDGNGYKDMTVGSHVSGHAVLFRGKPIVTIKYTLDSIPRILPEDLRTFLINVCFTYEMFNERSVDIKYKVTVDELLARALIGYESSLSTNVTIYKDVPACENITVTIKDTPTLDIKIPIQVSLSYDLNYPKNNKSITFVSTRPEQDNDGLNIRRPVLDTYKSNETFFETAIPFTLDCGSDNECQSWINVDIQFPQLSDNTLIIGSLVYLKMEVNITNTLENAYSTKFFVALPPVVFFRQPPQKCSSNGSAIVCDVGNPLRNNTNKPPIEFEIGVLSLDHQYDIDRLEIYSRISTQSDNSNNDTQLTTLTLKREADITIYGQSEQETNYYGNSSVSTSLLTHTYKIEKFGASSLEKLIVKLQVPKEYHEAGKKPVKFLISIAPVEITFGGQSFKCNVNGTEETAEVTTKTILNSDDSIETSKKRRRRQVEIYKQISDSRQNEDIKVDDEEVQIIANKTLFLNCSSEGVTCFEAVCSFGPYSQENTPASVTLRMTVNITEIAGMAKTKDMVLIATNGEVMIESPVNFIQYQDRPDVFTVSSLFINDITKPAKVALWIIILSAIIGILLLLLLIFGLIKAGFFKRSKKEELESLKAAADQEDKILEIIEGSKMEDDEMETTFDGEMKDEPLNNDTPTATESQSKEHLVDM